MTASFPGSVKSFGAVRADGDYIPAADMNTVREEVVAVETELRQGGWIADALTWAYNGPDANKIVIPGDVTGVMTKGTRLKWTQTTVKYGVVVSAAYAAPNTTVTIITNTDYTVTNAVISANYYSYMDNPIGWPGHFNYAPTGFSASVTHVGRYCIIGSRCFVDYYAIVGSAAFAWTGMPTLPVPVGANYKSVSPTGTTSGVGSYQDAGVGSFPYVLAANLAANGTTFAFRSTGGVTMSATVPITWANGDFVEAHVNYEW
jgi:hypothetical protein